MSTSGRSACCRHHPGSSYFYWAGSWVSLPAQIWYSRPEPPSFWNSEGKFCPSRCLRVVLTRALPPLYLAGLFSFWCRLGTWVSLRASGEGRRSLGPGHILGILRELLGLQRLSHCPATWLYLTAQNLSSHLHA